MRNLVGLPALAPMEKKEMTNWPSGFGVAEDYCADVLAGCYDLPYEAKTVLDIGANVGAFARWAKTRWQWCEIVCYEPQPENYTLLQRTVSCYALTQCSVVNIAVSNSAGRMALHENGNRGEWSFIKFGNGLGAIEVDVMDAANLPDADFIKIDTEGAEINILMRLEACGKLAAVNAIVLEYHSASHVAPLIATAQKARLKLHEIIPVSEHRGLMKFLRP